MLTAKRLLLSGYSVAVVVSLLTVLLRFLLIPLLQENAPLLIFILPVLFSAWYGGLRPGLLATTLCALLGTYFFVFPDFGFSVLDVANLTRITIFIVEGVCISGLSEALRQAKNRAEQAASKLRESEEQYRLLVEGVKDYAIFGLDPQGRITSWNSGAELMKGYTTAEVLGRHFSLFYTASDIAQGKPDQILQTAIAQEHVEDQGWRKRKDGSLFWADVVITALRDKQGHLYGFSKVTRDITQQKHNEEALQESYGLLQTMIEGTGDGIFVKDQQGRYKLANSATARIFNRSKEEILGKTDADLLPLDVAVSLQLMDRRVMETGVSQTFEEEIPELDGVHAFLTTKDPYRDAQGNITGVIGVARDITERKHAEVLRQQLLKDLSDVKFALDQAAILATTDAQGVITDVNEKFCDISKFSRTELIGQTHRLINSGYHSREFFRDLWSTIAQGNVWQGEIKNRAKDGTHYWVNTTIVPVLDESGRPFQYLAIRFDITQRKQAEAALQRSAQRLETLQQIDRAILQVTSPKEIAEAALLRLSQAIAYQQAMVVLFNLEANQAYVLAGQVDSKPAGSVLPIETLASTTDLQYREAVRYIEDLGTMLQLPSLLEQQFSQGTRSVLIVALIVENELIGDLYLLAHQPSAFDLESREIAQEVANQLAIVIQQAQLREQLQRYAEQLEQRVAERTAQLEETNQELEAFTYSVSHDLRAPLRTIQGFATALLDDCSDQLETFCRSYVDSIIDDTVQMNTLISDLLNYSRLTRTQISLQPTALDEIVDEALRQLTTSIQDKQAQIRVASPLPAVVAHRSTLIQVITNLISNAIKFVQPHTQPRVDIFATTERQDDQDWVRLSVVDNGIGIASEHQERIFRVFERLHGAESYPGTGIGLAIVRKGLERMGGRVSVESQLQSGSRFSVVLPKTLELPESIQQ